MTTPHRVELHIDELVFIDVDGLLRADGDRVSESFQRELSNLLERRPFRADVPFDLDAVTGLAPLRQTRSPHRLGRDLARVVHQRLVDGPIDRTGRSCDQ